MRDREPDLFFRNFLYRIPEDSGAGRAILATLRKGLGKKPGTVPSVLRVVYPHLLPARTSDEDGWEDPYLIVAPLFAFHPSPQSGKGNMGRTCYLIRDGAKGNPTTDKRFEQLLMCSKATLPDHLRRMVSLAKVCGIPIDYELLREDIALWEDPEQRVQRRWARAYWGAEAGL